VAQDFHLAKRYYDQAATFDEKAKVPRDIALIMLEVTRCTLLFARCHPNSSSVAVAGTQVPE